MYRDSGVPAPRLKNAMSTFVNDIVARLGRHAGLLQQQSSPNVKHNY